MPATAHKPRLVVSRNKLGIESGIPIPPRKPFGVGGGRPRTNPVYHMEVGDSYFVPCKTKRVEGRVRTGAFAAARTTGRTVVTRAVEGGIRIWRTA